MIPMLISCLYRRLCAKVVVKTSSYIVSQTTVDKSGLVLMVCICGEQCHLMDENKQGANSGRKRSILSIDMLS